MKEPCAPNHLPIMLSLCKGCTKVPKGGCNVLEVVTILTFPVMPGFLLIQKSSGYIQVKVGATKAMQPAETLE